MTDISQRLARSTITPEAILSGDRRALARAITLVESGRLDHREQALQLLNGVAGKRQALRIGLSGTPGVGKSTFTESMGLQLVEQGLRVAVLAVDPSSALTGGSILGDKTRMEQLSRHPNAFIRPSPSQTQLGGVARRSREAVALCEAAGFDVVIVETVGVGQSETQVAQMSDVFLLLLAPAGGDELQGVKRGIMEIADMIVINKADGDLLAQATRTCADYAGALRLLRARSIDPEGFPKALMVSALSTKGLGELWAEVQTLAEWRKASGIWDRRRKEQAVSWLKQDVQERILNTVLTLPGAADALTRAEKQVSEQHVDSSIAARQVVQSLLAQLQSGEGS